MYIVIVASYVSTLITDSIHISKYGVTVIHVGDLVEINIL